MHHAFIDRLWSEWQQRHPDKASRHTGVGGSGKPVSLDDVLTPFNLTVRQVLDTTVSELGYRYERWSASHTN